MLSQIYTFSEISTWIEPVCPFFFMKYLSSLRCFSYNLIRLFPALSANTSVVSSWNLTRAENGFEYGSGLRGPAEWGGFCANGTKQSPINVVMADTVLDKSLRDRLDTEYGKCTYAVIINDKSAHHLDVREWRILFTPHFPTLCLRRRLYFHFYQALSCKSEILVFISSRFKRLVNMLIVKAHGWTGWRRWFFWQSHSERCQVRVGEVSFPLAKWAHHRWRQVYRLQLLHVSKSYFYQSSQNQFLLVDVSPEWFHLILIELHTLAALTSKCICFTKAQMASSLSLPYSSTKVMTTTLRVLSLSR